MEEIGATNPKFTSHCKFNGANLCAHAQKTIPWHPFTRLLNKYLHCIHVLESLTQSLLRSFSLILRMRLIKLLPVINNILHTVLFCSCFFYFHHTPFSWACRSLRDLRNYFSNLVLCTHIVCQTTHLIS